MWRASVWVLCVLLSCVSLSVVVRPPEVLPVLCPVVVRREVYSVHIDIRTSYGCGFHEMKRHPPSRAISRSVLWLWVHRRRRSSSLSVEDSGQHLRRMVLNRPPGRPTPPALHTQASFSGDTNFSSSAKLLEATYNASARRRDRLGAACATPSSAKTPHTDWGAQRQKLPPPGALRSAHAQRQISWGDGAGTASATGEPSDAAAAAYAEPPEVGGELVDESASTESADALLAPPTPTRAPGLAGQLARAQALLSDASAEQMRLEAELAVERQMAAEAAASAAAALEDERARYRREVEFVRAGVDAASAQREAAASKRRDAQDRALRRAVREAEERTSAIAEAAAVETEQAHNAELAEQQTRYERQLGALETQLVTLAHTVLRMQGTGTWPGEPSAHAFSEEDDDHLDSAAAYQLLIDALESLEAAGPT